MSYRNDHDAAVARVEALERENARLSAENAKLRGPAAPKPRDRISNVDTSELARPEVRRFLAGTAILILLVVLSFVAAMAKGC